ncbi:hypothetical protein Sste5346_002216 [Sporothrix stenoceras]|uniref:Proteophosphoglycan ppg4 n=1 Tax=Sporothrix stenoceras TaxID=5173 RepID=A0ABR3ZKD3_9PEZI
MADPSLASNNPFRRKSTVPIASSTPSSSSAASGLTLDTTSTAGPAHPSLAKSSTFPQSPSDAPFTTHARAPGASGPTGNSGSAGDTYAYDYEDQDALRGRPQVSSDAFREHLQALPKSTEAPPSTTFLKPKPVKKVRVQSPPPSSPSSVDSVDADFEARFPSNLADPTGAPTGAPPATGFGDYGARGGLLDDRPVRNYDDYSSASDDSESDNDSAGRGGSTGPTAAISSFSSVPSQVAQQPPPNPFQKTLGDLEPGQASAEEPQPDPSAATSAGKATLDVDAFSRLLLTGQGPAAAPPPPPPARTEAIPQAQETPRTSRDIPENDDDRSGLIPGAPPASEPAPRQTLKKKPPPPSSRHGKLIKAQSKEKAPMKEASGGGEDPSSFSSDVNKPLPPPPARRSANASEDEDAMDSIFDREAAGKLPEPEVNLDPEAPEEAVPSPRPPTPPNASHSTDFDPSHPISDLGAEALVSSSAAPVAAATATTSSPHPKKPTPAPPPRRQAGHSRTESRSQPQGERPPLPAPPGDGSVSDQQRDKSPIGSPRSSLDSTRTRSRSSSLIKPNASANANSGANVPAPPPPRRANHASRPSTASFAAPLHPSVSSPALSPSALSDNDRSPGVAGLHPGVSTPTLVPQAGSTSGSGSSTPVPNRLLAKPPPPPARNTSVRHKERPAALASADSSGSLGSGAGSGSGRPSSVASFDAVARRVGPHHQPPPPPPTRQRGSSRGSMDAPASHANATTNSSLLSAPPSISSTPRKVSSESVRRAAGNSGQGLETAQEGDEDQANNAGVDDSGVANNILADLDALRREVDALRGQFKAE